MCCTEPYNTSNLPLCVSVYPKGGIASTASGPEIGPGAAFLRGHWGCRLCTARRTGAAVRVVRYVPLQERAFVRHGRWQSDADAGQPHEYLNLGGFPEVVAAQRRWAGVVAVPACAAGASNVSRQRARSMLWPAATVSSFVHASHHAQRWPCPLPHRPSPARSRSTAEVIASDAKHADQGLTGEEC